jgi:predicted dehydrogenase
LDDVLGRGDVDVVFVMTPSGLHAKIGVQAITAGKHVVTTKPMDVSTAACDELIRAADAAGVLVGVDYQSRYVDNNVRVAAALAQGMLGKPILGEVHLIDLLLWFMGTPTRVYGETAIMNHEIETEDIGQAILNFESGAKGGILGTTTFPDSPYFSAEVHGTEGGVLIDAALSGEMRVFGDGLEEKLQAIHNPLANVVEDVVSALNEGTPLRVDGREGRRTVALLENIYRSSREGKAVDYCD